MEILKIIIGDIIEDCYSQSETTGSELNSYICAEKIVNALIEGNWLDDEKRSIIEIKECIDDIYGQDCAYYGVDGLKIAKNIYDKGFRLCHEEKA